MLALPGFREAGNQPARIGEVTEPPDHITTVLRECEEALRLLATQGRLGSHSLATFMTLSATVRREMERRKGERRQAPRSTPERRMSNDEEAAAIGTNRRHSPV